MNTPAELRTKREKLYSDTCETVRLRMVEPYTGRLHDLILYRQLNAIGVRISEIDSLIRHELESQIPK
jgi:hypothetical protein